MELWLLVIIIISVAAVLFSQKVPNSNRKTEDSKIMLKQLLEGFGLEIPAELKDPESAYIKINQNTLNETTIKN